MWFHDIPCLYIPFSISLSALQTQGVKSGGIAVFVYLPSLQTHGDHQDWLNDFDWTRCTLTCTNLEQSKPLWSWQLSLHMHKHRICMSNMCIYIIIYIYICVLYVYTHPERLWFLKTFHLPTPAYGALQGEWHWRDIRLNFLFGCLNILQPGPLGKTTQALIRTTRAQVMLIEAIWSEHSDRQCARWCVLMHSRGFAWFLRASAAHQTDLNHFKSVFGSSGLRTLTTMASTRRAGATCRSAPQSLVGLLEWIFGYFWYF